ncbi:MAG: hypothetical protein JNL98_06810 [Bryobacterales bacterium]|nr:hypothetical protein [Bryobacterales bacterium]
MISQRRSFSLPLLPIALLLCATGIRAQSSTKFSPCTQQDTFTSRVRFADADRAKQILGRRDSWARQLSAFDFGARMRTEEPQTLDQFLAFASEAAMGWTPEEQAMWRPVIDRLNGALHGMNLRIPVVEILKTSGREEFGAAYTRGNAILFPQSLANLPSNSSRSAFSLLAHELFHVLSRGDSRMRDTLYALLGFELLIGFEFPAELESRRGSNPDAFEYLHAGAIRAGSGQIQAVPLMYSKLSLAEIFRLPSIFDAFDLTFAAVDMATGRIQRDSEGRPVTYPMSDTNWASLMARNTSYILHPEEVLADNFAILMEWRSEKTLPSANLSGFPVNDPGLLNSMKDVLEAGCGQ